MLRIQLAKRTETIQESATLALNARVKQMASAGKKVYNLTAGELACETPEFIRTAVASKLNLNKYTPVAGLPELRQAIANQVEQFYGIKNIEAENIVVTAGAKPALYASLLATVDPDDEVILPTPDWVSYRHLIELAGGVVINVPLTKKYDLDPDAIANHISPRTKAIIINSPHNPTGAVFSSASLAKTAAVLAGKNIMVIADDIYTKLVYTKNFRPITAYGFEQLAIINGFSKSQALTGWRIGYLASIDMALNHAVTNLLSHTMGNAALPGQLAALAALEQGDQPVMFKTLQKQRDLVDRELSMIGKLQHNCPEGAFYVFIDLRAITHDSVTWCERLLNRKQVALVPGEAFSAPGFARLSFVTDKTTLTEALKRIQQFVSEGSGQ
jgi:aspartate aminotransferase